MAAIKLSNNKRRQILTLADQALSQAQKGQYDLALRICSQADRQFKDYPEVMYARGMIASMQDDYATASEWLMRVCKAYPKNTLYLINYASCLLLCGQEDRAAEIYPKVMVQSPHLFEQANGYASYASALDAIGELKKATQIFEKGLSSDPENILLLKKTACIYNELNNTSAAMTLIEKAHEIAPDDAVVLFDAGVYLMQQGKLDEARNRLREALKLDPGYIAALCLLINSGSYETREHDLSALQKLYNQEPEGSDRRINAAFVLGKSADKAGDYEQAFDYWLEANEQMRKKIVYNEDEQDALHQAIISSFPAECFSGPADDNTNPCRPIFIVGMPRCGSTLLEQALSRHPALLASGEVDAMQQAIVGRSKKVTNSLLIKTIESLDDKKLTAIGNEYNRRLIDEYGLSGRWVDKTLNNYLYTGLIAKALPQARIIHLKREPMASCLSMFQEYFVGGSIPYAFDMQELGRQYSRYQQLMQHWREVTPTGVMLEVDYEELVSNPETELRRLLEGCGLEWHEDCLTSHKSTKSVTTASIFQVRKPMHRNSIARWKNYEAHLSSLSQHLSPPDDS